MSQDRIDQDQSRTDVRRVGASRGRINRPLESAGNVLCQVQLLARELGLAAGEVVEVLERLPFGTLEGETVPEAWYRPAARSTLEQYAARKRVVARLAARGLW